MVLWGCFPNQNEYMFLMVENRAKLAVVWL